MRAGLKLIRMENKYGHLNDYFYFLTIESTAFIICVFVIQSDSKELAVRSGAQS